MPKPVLEALAADYVSSLAKFETSRLDLVSRLNMLEVTKRCVLIEQVCSSMYSLRAFFRQSTDSLAEVGPMMQHLQVWLHGIRCHASDSLCIVCCIFV